MSDKASQGGDQSKNIASSKKRWPESLGLTFVIWLVCTGSAANYFGNGLAHMSSNQWGGAFGFFVFLWFGVHAWVLHRAAETKREVDADFELMRLRDKVEELEKKQR